MKNEDKKNSRVSRGYCGYAMRHNGQTEYLRSTLEFVLFKYVDYLSQRFHHIDFKVEEFYSEIVHNGKTYRPDFTIYKNGKLWKVVEVKSNKQVAEEYTDLYSVFFQKKYSVRFHVVYKSTFFNKIINKLKLNELIDEYKQSSIYDYSGRNNPRFGVIASDKTKKLIGEKTKERSQDPEYKRKFKDTMGRLMTDEKKRHLSLKQSQYQLSIKPERDRIRNERDPLTEYVCVVCDTKAFKRKTQLEQLKEQNRPLVCGYKCGCKYYRQNAAPKQGYDRVVSLLQRIEREYNWVIQTLGEFNRPLAVSMGLIHKNSPCSTSTIMKYFTTTQEEVKNGEVSFKNYIPT